MIGVKKKLVLVIALLIFSIEGILLAFSMNSREISLRKLQAEEYTFYKENKMYPESYIVSEVKKYRNNIIYLTLLICLWVSIGFALFYHRIIGRYIDELIKINMNTSPDDNIALFDNIPNDDIGRLIEARRHLHKFLLGQINENRQLIRILAHDLGNSQSVIIGNCDRLIKVGFKNLDEKMFQKCTEKISTNVKNQQNLLIKISEMEAMRSKKTVVEVSETSFRQMFTDSFNLFEEKLEAKELQLVWDNENNDDEEFYINVDETLFFNNVLNNLISNAIKFSKPGDTISIKTHSDSVDGHKFKVITVTDQGIGMPEDIIGNLFDPYVKTTRKGTNGEKGTGFGMPLVKESLHSVLGTIDVESKTVEEFPDDHGTIFTIKLVA